MSSKCDFCITLLESIKLRFEDPVEHLNSFPSHRLGYFDEIVALDCQDCKSLRHKIQVSTLETLHAFRVATSDTRTFYLEVWQVRGGTSFGFTVFTGSDTRFGISSVGIRGIAVELVNSPSAPWGSGKLLDPCWIDTGVFKTWKAKCDCEHGSCADPGIRGLGSLQPPRPGWFVDVVRFCLVAAPVLCLPQYVALSYVWGNVKNLQTLLSNVDSFQEHNAFLTAESMDQIPRTIRDAMCVTKLMGERYLWVDSLCIVQDDNETKLSYLNNMGSIYAHATVTIIAAQGDNANLGLTGIPRDGENPRKLLQGVYGIGKERLVDRIFALGESATRGEGGTWTSRGWTYQEGLFSGRRVIFEADSVRWKCSHSNWSEEVLEDSDKGYKQDKLAFDHKYPDIDDYQISVKDFNQRKLTLPQDSLFAFAGVTNILSDTFHGGFLCGLAELFFEHELLWSFRGKRKSDQVPGSVWRTPTWSWAGWIEEDKMSRYLDWDSRCKYVVKYYLGAINYSLTPILQWYTSDSLLSEGRRPVASNGYKFRDQACDLNQPLPPGWTRHVYQAETWDKMEDDIRKVTPGDGKYYYTHTADSSTKFWHPIPLRDPSDTLIFPSLNAYIFCRTQSATLPRSERRNDNNGHPYYTVIQDEKVNFLGAMAVNEISDKDPSNYELISISEGLRTNELRHGPPGWRDEERPVMGLVCGYYHVLWIEWDNEHKIAYRKGVGWVLKDVWKRLDTKWIDVTLG